MTIKILGGICSYNGQILSVNDVITSTEEHEKRLVELGVAVYENKIETPTEKTTNDKQVVDKQKDKLNVFIEEMQQNFEPVKAKSLNVENLVKLAKYFGIEEEKTFNEKGERLKKAEIIKLIVDKQDDQAEQVNQQPDEANTQEQGESDNQNDDNIPDDKTEHQNDETNQGVELSFTAGE